MGGGVVRVLNVQICLRKPVLGLKKTTFSAKSVRIENRRGDKIVDELELEVADVVGVGVVDEFKVGEQKLCRREFGGGRRLEHHSLWSSLLLSCNYNSQPATLQLLTGLTTF